MSNGLIQASHPGDVAIPVPYVTKLGQKLAPGQTLIVHGKVSSEAHRFEINLMCGSAEINPGLAALHLSIRFDEKKIVMNSFKDGVWGKEERVSNPFKVNEPFDIRVRAHEDKFEISANQKAIHEYKYRIPLEDIEYLAIRGDVTLSGVHWGGRYFKLPFETVFPGGHFQPEKRLFLSGIPKGNRFEVNFVNKKGDILFHFNPRMSDKVIVRNAKIGASWGKEEREGPFPFKKEIGFDLVFLNEPFSIQIFYDGERIGTYAHRTDSPKDDYYGFRVDGDVEVTGIEFDYQ
ncbi:hypothetical protein AB6A40_000595 [Gnathostoma spinigerum]|uniref:Galectin n=1 Tax=Gnathostoma spinigerum TaxID=75299 RepID=A0ABD6E943_9BILA